MLSHAGPMTRTAEDSALLFNLLKGPDPRDHNALPDDGHDYLRDRVDPRGLKIAYAPSLFGVEVDPEVARVIAASVATISAALDRAPSEVAPDWQNPIRIFETLWVAGRGQAYGRLGRQRRRGLRPRLSGPCAKRLESIQLGRTILMP